MRINPIFGRSVDDSSCRRTVLSMDDDERLNVIAPLQVNFYHFFTGLKWLSKRVYRFKNEVYLYFMFAFI